MKSKRFIAIALPLILVAVMLTGWQVISGPQTKKSEKNTKGTASDLPAPIDPQVVQDQDDMKWEDYKPIP